jgi:O-acetyl-ADP-ribose deacetylase (regulator of RNase III)
MARIEVREADVTKLQVDAIANAANTQLLHGGGVAGAIVRAGGESIQTESLDVAPIALGEAVDEAARIEVEEVRRHVASGSALDLVVFAVRGEDARAAFEAALEQR